MQFEWDEQKGRSNLVKHRLDFAAAPRLFDGDHVLLPSRYVGETRMLTVGFVDGLHVTVVYTMREESYRIISMRRSREQERREYQSVHGRGAC